MDKNHFGFCLATLTLLQSTMGLANAECNNATDWRILPSASIKVLIGHEQVLPYGVSALNVTSSEPDSPYPPLLSSNEISRLSTTLSRIDSSPISYYEQIGENQWRICRRERWLPPSAGDDAGRKAMLKISSEYVSKNATLAQVTQGHVALDVIMFFYDKKGRLAKIAEGDFTRNVSAAQIKICRTYDDQDRLLLFLNPRTTQTCSHDEPDVRDEWIRYKFASFNGEQIEYWDEWHRGDQTGRWSKRFNKFRTGFGANHIDGAAKAKSQKGVTTIYGSNAGKLDDNPANTVLNSFGQGTGSTYYFTKPSVPLKVLEDPGEIYKYERRRQTYIEGPHFRLYELFKPNEHISHHRYYYLRSMLRNEQVDAKGRVTRVITVNDYRQPRPGPNPAVNDKLLTDKGLRIFGHQIYHRVYNIDAKGIPVLVAVSWNRKARLNPFKKTHIDFADLAFGTPDGKVRWKKLEDFEKYFSFSSSAAEVFPDRTDSLDDDDD